MALERRRKNKTFNSREEENKQQYVQFHVRENIHMSEFQFVVTEFSS